MRRFYIFNVRSELQNLYKENYDNLYKILNSLYNMSSDELAYGYNLFKQICIKIDTLAINNKLYLRMHNDLVYTKIDNEHVINNLYKDEVSVLKVKKSHMVLDCNTSYSSFFSLLHDFGANFFVCDFGTGDYFFLSDIELIVD